MKSLALHNKELFEQYNKAHPEITHMPIPIAWPLVSVLKFLSYNHGFEYNIKILRNLNGVKVQFPL